MTNEAMANVYPTLYPKNKKPKKNKIKPNLEECDDSRQR